MKLRDYQQDAVDAVWQYLRDNPKKNPCVVIPTGGGKTPVIAELCRQACSPEWGGRVIVLAHQKELLEQSAQKLAAVAPEIRFGIYSASIGSRDVSDPVVLCQIQSARRIGAGAFGRRDLILVDEAHLIPTAGDGQYRTFLSEAIAATPHVRLVGLTATPYRLGSGLICGANNLLHEICYEVGVRDLIDQGFLSRLISRPGSKKTLVDLTGVGTSGGDYNEGELGRAVMRGSLVADAVDDFLDRADQRKTILVFCVTIEHAETVLAELRNRGQSAELITGKTGGLERAWNIQAFKEGKIRFLVNVGTLTTGVDVPNIDAVVLLRPTKSTGLYYQMVGRGFRLSPGKEDCLVLDYGRNISRHGPVDNLVSKPTKEAGANPGGQAPMKPCPSCGESYHIALPECPFCGTAAPNREENQTPAHESMADQSTPILSEPETEHEINYTHYSLHIPRGARAVDENGLAKPPSMRVDYYLGKRDLAFESPVASEWVCFEHQGFARNKAIAWWRARSRDPVPDTVERAVEAAAGGALAETLAITVKNEPGSHFKKIARAKLGPKPEIELDGAARLERQEADSAFNESLPF